MDKTISERPRHREVHATLRCRVAGGDDDPPFGEHVFAQFTVENELVAAGLRHLRRRGQLVQKENAFAFVGQELGRNPLGLIRRDARQTAQIDRIELNGAHVKKCDSEIARHLGDDLRLAHAARAPDVQRHTFADQRMKRLVKLGWFHLYLPQAEYWFGCEERPVSRLFGNALECGAGRFGAEQLRQYKLIPG
jgi:hypothetical protein